MQIKTVREAFGIGECPKMTFLKMPVAWSMSLVKMIVTEAPCRKLCANKHGRDEQWSSHVLHSSSKEKGERNREEKERERSCAIQRMVCPVSTGNSLRPFGLWQGTTISSNNVVILSKAVTVRYQRDVMANSLRAGYLHLESCLSTHYYLDSVAIDKSIFSGLTTVLVLVQPPLYYHVAALPYQRFNNCKLNKCILSSSHAFLNLNVP